MTADLAGIDPTNAKPVSNSGVNSTKAHDAIAVLLTGATQRETAAAVGVSHSTIQRWLADAGFSRRLMEAQEETIKAVRRRVTGHAIRAADVLMELAQHGDKDDGVRASAARALLSAFAQLQPRQLEADITMETNTVRYEVVGVDVDKLT